MPTSNPHIFVSPRMMASIDTWSGVARAFAVTQFVEGHHAFWAARIPYVPSMMLSAQDTQVFGLDANNRIRWFLDRQLRFLSDLSQIVNHQATFELRYIADPRQSGEARVTIALIGKSFAADPGEAERVALAQWERVRALFPGEAPYHYPLAPITTETDPPGTAAWDRTGFFHVFEPIGETLLDQGAYRVVELRKHEDWPTHRATGAAAMDVDYITHPFSPPVDYTGMARLLETLARQRYTAYVGVTVRPQRLAPRELLELARFAQWYDSIASGTVIITNPVLDVQRPLGLNGFDAYYRQRAALGKQVYEGLLNQQEALFLMTVRAVAAPEALPALIEALGTELITNSDARYPSHYDPCVPEDANEMQWARFNMRWLEMQRWGVATQLANRPDLARFRFLATKTEAVAAFRLPTATPGAHLHGVTIMDEPFNAQSAEPSAADDVTGLGQVVVNGAPLTDEYRLPRRVFAQGVAIFGADDETRSETLRALLAYQTAQRLSAIVLGPATSQSMQTALSMARAVCAYDEASAPDALHPAEGVAISHWAAGAARALALAFEAPTSVCPTLQMALLDMLVAAGGQPMAPWPSAHAAPTTAEFVQALPAILAASGASEQTQQLLRDRCLPGLRELAMTPGLRLLTPTAGALAPVFAQSQSTGLDRGDLAHRALFCVRALLSLESAERRQRDAASNPPLGALTLIEAHDLLPAQRSNDQPLAPLFARLQQAQGAVVWLTTQPERLDTPALTGGAWAAQRQTKGEAINVCQQAMRLSERETRRLSALTATETLWNHDGETVLTQHRHTPPLALGGGGGGAVSISESFGPSTPRVDAHGAPLDQ